MQSIPGGPEPGHPASGPEHAGGHETLAALSVVLVDLSGRPTTGLEHLPLRRGNLAAVTAADDVAMLRGRGAGRLVHELAARLGTTMPPVLVIAPEMDRDDAYLALSHGATSYLIEGERPGFLGADLDKMIVMTAAGMSCLDPGIATELTRRLLKSLRRGETDEEGHRHAPSLPVESEALAVRQTQITNVAGGGCATAEVADRQRVQRARGLQPPGAHSCRAARASAGRGGAGPARARGTRQAGPARARAHGSRPESIVFAGTAMAGVLRRFARRRRAMA